MRHYASADRLQLFADLHGHSRRNDIYTYGCENSRSAPPGVERVFPRLLAECPYFSLPGCSYKVLKSKESTGRVVVWRQFSLPHSYTLETSFCGTRSTASDASSADGLGKHFNTGHLRKMGASMVAALAVLTDPCQTRVNEILTELAYETNSPATDVALTQGMEEEMADVAQKGRRMVKNTLAAPVRSRRGSAVSGNTTDSSLKKGRSRRNVLQATSISV